MKTAEAKKNAREWMKIKAPEIRGLIGAVMGGSANFRKDDEPWPESSDIDIWVMVNKKGIENSINLDKIVYKGVILEVTCKDFEDYNAPEKLLSSPFEGYHFACPGCVLWDTGNTLKNLVDTVSKRFSEPEWIKERLQWCRRNAVGKFQWARSETENYFNRMMGFILGVKNIATMPVIADLKHPTVRRALAISREVLKEYGRLVFHEKILALCGAEKIDARTATQAAQDLIPAFRRAIEVVKTPFFSSGSLKEDVIPLYLQGTDEMIKAGYHREVMHHLIFYYWRVYQALANDTPDAEKAEWKKKREAVFNEWGLASPADVGSRAQKGLDLMTEADEICLKIMNKKK